MPMQETKRIEVRPKNLIVEDKGFPVRAPEASSEWAWVAQYKVRMGEQAKQQQHPSCVIYINILDQNL